jgi:DNA-cytosine methyltransferase
MLKDIDMKVLSLFDGKRSGYTCLKKAGFNNFTYYSCENDKYANAVGRYHYPDCIELGDVEGWLFWEALHGLKEVDILIGGSPCQGFSFAGKQLNFTDPRSKLFFEYVKILKFYKPKYFLLENVVMKKEYQDIISNLLGVQPILINSSLVSAQSRKRLYWTNIPDVKQPEDKNIYLKDIIQSGIAHTEKSYCIDAGYWKTSESNPDRCLRKSARQIVFEPVCGAIRGRYIVNGKRQDHYIKTAGLTTQRLELRKDRKTNTLTTVQKDNVIAYPVNIPEGEYNIRKLTPVECERLQTYSDNFTKYGKFEDGTIKQISNTQRYKICGNGWTDEVITHIFKNIKGL